MTTLSMKKYFEPRSESRPDLVLEYEIMQTRIATRKQRDREKRIVAVLAATLIVVAFLGLSFQKEYEAKQCEQQPIVCQM
jgi:hypothetical protein